ncbi:DUF2939 domain-containing protein [Hydrogenophaga sp. SL48]|uniref:DUF2939 domain-containing protein n=1 Tax=Hydrogenophaga sp. SL48 TaxID=2806347 RepID=UPI001F30EEE4|nr:DUF2939 domain-containing protein [Hydrogenophaga sp. SL48]UJW79450.1 DUF2939 domain-containing protein [Hydrogenophaga sp. SL48]
MSLASNKAALAAIAVAAAGIGAYWHYSPYLVMKSLRAAAEARNADAFNEKVDYPKLRESLKGQMAAMVADKIGTGASTGNQFEAMGSAMALALINPLIDAMVRPELVMKAMSNGELSLKPGRAETRQPGEPKQEPKWDVERVSMNKVIAYAQDAKDSGAAKFGVVFERSGFADWKLTELRMPTPPSE